MLIGPRQVGKSTAAKALEKDFSGKALYVSADAPTPPDHHWLKDQWLRARSLSEPTLLILDDIQKMHGWSEEYIPFVQLGN